MAIDIQEERERKTAAEKRAAARQARIDRMNAGKNKMRNGAKALKENLSKVNAARKEAGKMICTQCGSVGKPVTVVPGSIGVEIFLWLCILFPGMFYTVWRYTATKKNCCPSCRTPTMIPKDSPVGKKLLADISS